MRARSHGPTLRGVHWLIKYVTQGPPLGVSAQFCWCFPGHRESGRGGRGHLVQQDPHCPHVHSAHPGLPKPLPEPPHTWIRDHGPQ